MKNSQLIFHFLAGALLSLICVGAIGQAASPSARTLTASLPVAKVEATVKILGGTPCIFDVSAYGWGAENTCPKEVITAVVVDQAGVRQIVPLSAFADLTAPRSMELVGKSQKSFTLMILGGDASTAYKAYLRFNGVGLSSRRVESGEFPKESNETTTYRYNLSPR
jgi:hypothetical protein